MTTAVAVAVGIVRGITSIKRAVVRVVSLSLILSLWCSLGCAEPVDFNRLVDAIGKAENSKVHPYGIMQSYKHTTPRQACMNTVRHKYRDWVSQGSKGDFIAYLGSKYAPTVGAKNDPRGLNKNWIKNVNYFLKRQSLSLTVSVN